MPSFQMRRTRNRVGLAAIAVLGLATLPTGSAAQAPAHYVAPVVGTTYHYTDFRNTVTSVVGQSYTFRDQAGRAGRRLGHFITADSAGLMSLEAGALGKLWPLTRGKTASFTAGTPDGRQWRWEFRVLDTATVTVPAGRYRTFLVQGVRAAEVAPLGQATVETYTWWYAPDLRAVVKVRTQYVSGPGSGRSVGGELVRIEPPARARR